MSSNPMETVNMKVVIIGNSGVGKTRLLVRYVDNTFTSTFYNTIGVDFKTRIITLDNKKIRMQIWDTAGQQRYRTITSSIYKRTHGVIIVYDITDRDSFDALKSWQNEAEKNVDSNVMIMVIGNKIDQQKDRVVSVEEAKEYAFSHSFLYMEGSALSDKNIKEAFEELASNILKRMYENPFPNQTERKSEEKIVRLDGSSKETSPSLGNNEARERKVERSQKGGMQCSC